MKTNKPLISILVPTYNRLNYLKECLDSIVSQKWFLKSDLELIVSDNSDNDETKKFMNQYIKENNNWGIYYNKNNKNLWMVWNWNKLLELKKWEYFIFLSDDDKFYDENSLKILYDNLIKYNLDVCYWRYMCINELSIYSQFKPHNKVNNKDIYYDIFQEQIIWHTISFWWILYKSIWKVYDENFWNYADWDFNLNYLYNWKKIWLINKYTFLYKIHTNQNINSINVFLDYKLYILWMKKYKYNKITKNILMKIIKVYPIMIILDVIKKIWLYSFFKKIEYKICQKSV